MAEPPSPFRYKPPSQFQRWVTTHPLLWVGIIVAAVTVPGLANGVSSGHLALEAVVVGCIAALLAVGSSISLVFVRHRIGEYDAWVTLSQPESAEP